MGLREDTHCLQESDICVLECMLDLERAIGRAAYVVAGRERVLNAEHARPMAAGHVPLQLQAQQTDNILKK